MGETVTKLALFVTDQVQALPVVTVNVALPPVPAMLNVDVEMAYVQVDWPGGVGEVGDFEEQAAAPEAAISRMINARTYSSARRRSNLCTRHHL
jgi:hypothetical protein